MSYKNPIDFRNIDFPDLDLMNQIFSAALISVDPMLLTTNSMKIMNDRLFIQRKEYPLSVFNKIYILGIGKASQLMALGAKKVLANWNPSGLVITKNKGEQETIDLLPEVETIKGSHPIPDEKSIIAAENLFEFTKKIEKNDLVICLISGGGSSLITKPVKGIGLNEIQSLTSQLLKCGATIDEINTIRKHVDSMKGGGLLSLLYPAQTITLILSDVIGDDISMIASGPTISDKTTFHDALQILAKYDLKNKKNEKIIFQLERGEIGLESETLKENDPKLDKVQNVIIGNNYTAASAAKKRCEALGFHCQINSEPLIGNTSDVSKKITTMINSTQAFKFEKPICFILGGESTVQVTGNGKGGRNQEVALRCALEISGMKKVCIATLATDGEDGPTDAAGAIVTGDTISQAEQIGINPHEYLANNDSYNFFKQVGGLIKTGPTGTNVNDLNFVFIY
jgi:glycerate 2-kinase